MVKRSICHSSEVEKPRILMRRLKAAQKNKKVGLVAGSPGGRGAEGAGGGPGGGFGVIKNSAGTAAPADALARKIEEKGGHALTVKADVSDAKATRRMFDAAD